ncbi:DNA polymerase III subunit epsilon [Qipengyuania huizhouensis]|uniref:DNA polymerase III subunit epsilon n=1 Tax=Qipengyuania huizhouensis TaxID=2867245 RepID=UPI0017DAFA2F|nr:DNA polymerase III subunit epsilon [Qipengyuania huizhouensis]MBA4763913.1 DNA polymerase III subunit epsilon [Erythrobacter sp.]MBX7459916.1 DNA polymerase III subunit epsilon [Qipengyuania huizhouensis]
MREIVFDTETTGLDPKTGDRMVEIGCVELFNLVPTGKTYHAYYNPERDMPAGAEAVHGLSSAFLADKPLFRDIFHELLEFIGDAPLIAHNAGFDFGFLNAELALCKCEPVCMTRMIDTVALAKKRHPGAKLSLDALCTRYGIDRSHRVKHGALLDAELLAQVYVELKGGRQIGLELAAEAVDPVTTQDLIAVRKAPEGPRRAPRPHAPTAEELVRHRQFMAGIENPLWG